MTRKKRAPSRSAAHLDLVENHQKAVRVDLSPLRLFLANVRHQLKLGSRGVGVRLIDDREMTRLNQTYRKKKGTTDVLSFPFEDDSAAIFEAKKPQRKDPAYLGDIAISPKVARRNAQQSGRSFLDELRILILHGVIHLLGYDHETDQGQMDTIEQTLRRRLGLA
ncbi:MAG TPA: rRNA maturation RNase YbeY [Candidatus Acidoferrum sp.]|jgi:probable rRNA maturation factor